VHVQQFKERLGKTLTARGKRKILQQGRVMLQVLSSEEKGADAERDQRRGNILLGRVRSPLFGSKNDGGKSP